MRAALHGRQIVAFLERLVLVAVVGILASFTTRGEESMTLTVKDVRRTTLYHSPQKPGFTCWASLWKMPDKSLMVSFTQATGPVKGWRPCAPKPIRERLGWPPMNIEEYDMTGLVLENMYLGSTDRGKTWTKVSADPFWSPMNSMGGLPHVALRDGTILRAVWGQYLPYWDVPQTGYLQRSKDGTRTWGPPEMFSTDDKLLTFPKRIRVLSDGRIVMTGGAMPNGDRWHAEYLSKCRPCLWVSKDKEGRSWSGPLYLLPFPGDATGTLEECDVVELENGNLFAVYRTVAHDEKKGMYQTRRQNVLVKTGETFEPGPVTAPPFIGGGQPELLRTREGPILHPMEWWWTSDLGIHWRQLNGLKGCPYYPSSVQLDDGTILVVGHVGGDDPYGKRDQSIVLDSFRVTVASP